MVLFVISVWVLALGTRGSELSQRSALAEIVQERTLRFQTDFLLSQVGAPPETQEVSESEDEDASDVFSGQSETLTATIFGSSTKQRQKMQDPAYFAMVLQGMHKLAQKERWLVPCSSLELIPEAILGSGSFGVVILGKLQGAAVAVKVPVAGSAARRFQSLMAELRVFRRLRHQNIVHFHGACVDVDRQEVVLVEELVEGYILLGICTAMRHIHNLTPVVVHGDIKPDNVLVDSRTLMPKLVDFGLARIIQGRIPGLGGSVRYAAPDVHLRQKPSPASDIFSFGRLAYFVVTGEKPMQEHSARALALLTEEGISPELRWKTQTPIQQQQQQQQHLPYQHHCKELCSECCVFDPELRPTARDVHI
ncbi:unnamed protein product [Polarella glacialis]|uniref:Protein kinase domain-containing protein n=1 Tax=Polarella glacialis TaxID=89957 RepID=A0A813I952_POLGL|nr:unnamed protein product [Polarella glacialis]